MKVYLSGPMQGYPEFNYPLFNKVAAELREQGHEVYNPAEYKFEGEFPVREAFAEYCNFICTKADTIAMLPGWEFSKGATMEYRLAKICGLKISLLSESVAKAAKK